MLNRIWKKFTLALLGVALIPIGYFGWQDLQSARASVMENALQTIFLNCVTRAKDIERIFLNAHTDISYFRESLTMRIYLDAVRANEETAGQWKTLLEKEFATFLSVKPGYSQVGFLDEYGDEVVVVANTGDRVMPLLETQKRNRLTSSYYIRTAQLERRGVAAIPMRSAMDPSLDLRRVTLIRYATKVFDDEGEARGIIYIDLNGLDIYTAISQTSFNKRRQVNLLTNEGNYIYTPYPDSQAKMPLETRKLNVHTQFPDRAVQQILSGRPGVVVDDPDDLLAFSPIYPQVGNFNLYYVVFDHYSKELFNPLVDAIKQKYLLRAVLAAVLCLLVAALVSYALTRHLGKLREGAEQLSKNRFDYRLDIRSGDEIESLAKAYNIMAEALHDYSESLENKVEERSRHIRKVERKLIQAERLAAVGFLSAGVAHEINNPIAVIITRLELVKRSLDKGSTEHLRKDLDVLHKQAVRIGKIAGNLLTFSRENSSACEEADLNAVLEKALKFIDHPIRQKGIELVREFAPDLPPAWINPLGMEQVIHNIVYNAYQATGENGTISVSTALNTQGRIELTITDTGIGIPADAIDQIFEPFFTTKEVNEGTGLGLSICYGIIQDFGGSIQVKSAPAIGTTFTITLDTAAGKNREQEKDLIGSGA